jgi:hypothetical protein
MSKAVAREHVADLGPAMAALTEKQRAFVLALFDAPKSHGLLTLRPDAQAMERRRVHVSRYPKWRIN